MLSIIRICLGASRLSFHHLPNRSNYCGRYILLVYREGDHRALFLSGWGSLMGCRELLSQHTTISFIAWCKLFHTLYYPVTARLFKGSSVNKFATCKVSPYLSHTCRVADHSPNVLPMLTYCLHGTFSICCSPLHFSEDVITVTGDHLESDQEPVAKIINLTSPLVRYTKLIYHMPPYLSIMVVLYLWISFNSNYISVMQDS